MVNKDLYLKKISSDLGFDRLPIKGQNVPVRDCWHFYTSGDSVDVLFQCEEDFRNGMNRIYPAALNYDILILAFVLMDTHIHFILYGAFDSCNRFIHEYVRRTSIYIKFKYSRKNALKEIKISYQNIDNDRYLKSAICYVIKNPVSAGLNFNTWDYPWSSCSLYFRTPDSWTSPRWMNAPENVLANSRNKRTAIKTRIKLEDKLPMVCGLINPEYYVSADIVEKIFRTHRAYNFFMNISKDIDVESKEGAISYLTVPIVEMRENRNMISRELFGTESIRDLNMPQRVKLARVLKSRFNSSEKQIAKVCGLVFSEVKDLL